MQAPSPRRTAATLEQSARSGTAHPRYRMTEMTALAEQFPDRVFVGSVDATDTSAVTAFIKEAAAHLGPIDALVNNAAISPKGMELVEKLGVKDVA